jgi:hypothetical protein
VQRALGWSTTTARATTSGRCLDGNRCRRTPRKGQRLSTATPTSTPAWSDASAAGWRGQRRCPEGSLHAELFGQQLRLRRFGGSPDFHPTGDLGAVRMMTSFRIFPTGHPASCATPMAVPSPIGVYIHQLLQTAPGGPG